MFTIYNDSGSDSTMVSNLFIDEYMKSANDAQIKVYLYLLRMMGTHRATSVSDMADQFNHTEKDVVRSLRYWEKKGLLDLDFGSGDTLVSIRLCRPGRRPEIVSDNTARTDENRVLSFSKPAEDLLAESAGTSPYLRMASGGEYTAQTSLSADALSGSVTRDSAGDTSEGGITAGRSAARQKTGKSSHGSTDSSSCGRSPAASRPSELEALESFRSEAGRARLLFVIEQYIGKPLSLNEIRIIYYISEVLRFSDDMIDYLLQYCVDRGKKDFRYIRKVAENWAKAGIMTPAQAETAAAQESVSAGDKSPRGAAKDSSSDAAQSGAQDASPRSSKKRKGRASGPARSANSFNQFEQNSYDFDALEEELLQG